MPDSYKKTPKVPILIETLIKGMPEIAYVFSEEGNLLTWNKNLEILFGYSKEELNNKFMLEFIYDPDKEIVIKKFMKILSDHTVNDRTIEYRIRTKSGKIVPVLAFRSNIFIDGQNYIIGIAIDLSKLKKDKAKLKTQITEIIHLKSQLQDHYRKIEKMNQNEIELKEKIFLNAKNFNNKLIHNLPGIFYLYEKIEDKFFLKKWNKNYTTDLGYLEDEILNMQPQQFFTEKEFKKVISARVGARCDGLKAHTLHQESNPFMVNGIPLVLKPISHAWITKLWVPHILFVDQAHQEKVLFCLWDRLVVNTRPWDTCQPTLPPDRIIRARVHPISPR